VPRGHLQLGLVELLHARELARQHVRIPGALGQQFGFVANGNTGYRSNLTNTGGTTWGCQERSTPAGSLSGCSTYFVACR
jgi:hypothetical protein